MGFVGGDLMKVYAVGISFFGISAILFFIWLFTTKRKYLQSMLCYAALSNTAMFVLTLTLGFKFSLTTRSDGVQVFWLRWAFYAVIYGLCGVTQLYAEISCQKHYYQRWITSLLLGITAVGPAVASTSGDESQRIVALCLSILPFTAFSITFWVFANNRRTRTIILMIVVNVLVALYALWFSMGSSGFAYVRGYNFVWESATYLIHDALLIVLLPAICCVLHCPCAMHGACAHGKKHDDVAYEKPGVNSVYQEVYEQQQQQQYKKPFNSNEVAIVELPDGIRL